MTQPTTPSNKPGPGQTSDNTHHMLVALSREAYRRASDSADIKKTAFGAVSWTPPLADGYRLSEMSLPHWSAFREAVLKFNQDQKDRGRSTELLSVDYIRRLPNGSHSNDPDVLNWQVLT